MFGGILTPSVVLSNKQYITAFSNTHHHFDSKANLIRTNTFHQQQIVSLSIYPSPPNSIFSIDKSGTYIISSNDKVLSHHNINHSISQAFLHQDHIIFTSQNQLYYYNTKLKKPQSKLKYQAVDNITFIQKTDDYLLLGEGNKLQIFSIDEGKFIKVIHHTNLVTCGDVNGKDVVVGDNKGKIYCHIGGIEEEEIQSIEKRWHTGRVNAVVLREGNLISAGEEGVVVFWHLSTEKKDFLPRFGSDIRTMVFDQQKHRLSCFLGDNSIKIVLLDSDKTVLHLKTIINPNGVKTKRTLIEDYKFLAGAHHLKESGFICLNSTPGKLQFISPFNSHYELDVSNRNTVSRLDDDYPNPIQVKCVSFSKDQNTLAVYANNRSVSYLKIFNKQQKYQLLAKINNPHLNQMIQIVNYQCSKDMTTKFVSIGSDKLLKVWKQRVAEKKSLKQESQVIWSCQTKFSHKNREFVAVQPVQLPNGNGVGITLADHHFILLNINSGEIIHEVFLEGLENSYYLGSTIAYQTQNQFAICDYTTKKNLFSLNTLIKRFSVSPSEKTIVVVHQFNEQQIVSLIEVKKKKQIKISKSYKLKNASTIQSIFWREEIPVAITSNLQLIGFGKTDLFNKENKEIESTEGEEQQEEENEAVDFLERYKNAVNKRLYSNDVQKELNEFMETIRDLPQVGNRFRLLADIILE